MGEHKAPVDCAKCQHYRPQCSFVDTYKAYDDATPRTPLMESLKALRKQETEVLEHEVELMFELTRSEEPAWPETPRVAPYCAVGERALIASMKNRRRDCIDFWPAFSRTARACSTCSHIRDPATRIGDRENSITRHDPEYWQHWMGVNKDQETADATAQGLEVEQAFHAGGVLPVVQFLPTCGAKASHLGQLVVPFCNVRADCDSHRSLLPITDSFLTTLRQRATETPAPDWVASTIDLVKHVASTHPSRPVEFLERVAAFPFGGRWAITVVRDRWLDEVGQLEGDESAKAQAKAQALTVSLGPSPIVEWPIVAGCDPVEWGALAAIAKDKDHEKRVAVTFAQQVAEWSIGTFHPTPRARGVAAAVELLRCGAFPAQVVDLCEPLLLKLRAVTFSEEAALVDDPFRYCESFMLQLSLRAKWLRAFTHHRQREKQLQKERVNEQLMTFIGKSTAQRRDRAMLDSQRGREVARTLLSMMEQSVMQPPPANFMEVWLHHIDEDKKLVIEELTDQERFVQASVLMQAQNGNFYKQVAGENLVMELAGSQQVRFQENLQNYDALILRPKKMSLFLLLTRGTGTHSPCALGLLKRVANYERVPQTLDEALLEPTGSTLEALHASRFDTPARAVRYLATTRRIASPTVTFSGGES